MLPNLRAGGGGVNAKRKMCFLRGVFPNIFNQQQRKPCSQKAGNHIEEPTLELRYDNDKNDMNP